ncbi:four helix bundle protein [Mucilaginibacter sp. OK268]|uniref:four helix bundle protein n=1 Tax=Mucilaginibacter sp. OK268 TaxID=1881048 RepID=UPI000891A22E|nr:four helix bundle protein [Mucilaginibacter sp. OK268]SDQ01350.1 four helix bundle protein [Mucilaginibacter sp. OK268]
MDAKENNVKKYNLEDRTFDFANSCKEFLKTIDRNIHNVEYYKQLIRSSGSVAANFIEANESFSRNDFSTSGEDLPEGSKRKHIVAQID